MNTNFTQWVPTITYGDIGGYEVRFNPARKESFSATRNLTAEADKVLMETSERYREYAELKRKLIAIDPRFEDLFDIAVPYGRDMTMEAHNGWLGATLDRSKCSIYCSEHTHVLFELLGDHSDDGCACYTGEAISNCTYYDIDEEDLMPGSCAYRGAKFRIDCRKAVEQPPRDDGREIFVVTYFFGPLTELPAAWDACHPCSPS